MDTHTNTHTNTNTDIKMWRRVISKHFEFFQFLTVFSLLTVIKVSSVEELDAALVIKV